MSLGDFFDWQRKHELKPGDVDWIESIRHRIIADIRNDQRGRASQTTDVSTPDQG